MSKLINGPGWVLVPDNEPEHQVKSNSLSPRPKIRLEKRAGKLVTMISGLHTYGTDRLNNIARELKIKCGAGGTVKKGVIEIQGDKTVQVKAWIEREFSSFNKGRQRGI